MGSVTDYLISLIEKQVNDYCLVVWFDPEKQYKDVAQALNIPETKIAHYDGSFFALRHEIEPYISGYEPRRLIVYVPLDHAETRNALAEVEAAGVIMRPGQQPPARNTRLSVIARNALKPIVGEDTAASIEKQVEAGKLTLADLDALAEKGEGITRGVVSVIFGAGNPQEVALSFLSSERHDAELVSKNAVPELAMLLQSAFGVELPGGESPNNLRTRLSRFVLQTDFLTRLRGAVPSELQTLKIAAKPAMREACATLANTWRLRRDLRESYVAFVGQVEKELGLSNFTFEREQIANVETFLEVERALQREIESALLIKSTDDLVQTAKDRQSSFWSEHIPNMQAHWALVAVAGQLLLEADRIEQQIKSGPDSSAKAIFNSYIGSENPLCLLDTNHRHMERRYHNFDFEAGTRHDGLKQLISKARYRYMEVGAILSEKFLRRYQESKYRLTGVLRQTEIYKQKVKPKIAEGKTAYIWVDALRFEMGRDMVQSLSDEFDLQLESAVGTVPTITEIGMAALLPSAEGAASVVAVGDSKLALKIDNTIIKDRKDRVKFLKSKAGVNVFDVKLEDLLPSPKRRIEEGIREADLILVTSQEIDALCEGDNVPLARRTMDDILHELRRAFRVLAYLGIQSIVLTADHGYLFGEELDEAMKIDAPGGETVDLHRRVWVGHGGTADPAYLRARLSDFGLGGDFEIAAPWNFACFRVKGGAKAYFHGGMSLQELVIPVITLKPTRIGQVSSITNIEWKLIAGSQKISTRFFSVQIRGVATNLFEFIPPKVRVEIRAKGESISTPVSASYGFEEATGDIQLRLDENDPKAIEPNTVTLAITKESNQKGVNVHLLDATSGAELARLDKIEMAISIL
ncbi:MAG: PglZ domain-containing protein [Pyrinomonadaceae bacterium]|nr:PglZ domain-containing protein [Pyrinomonadaceae bacterium]